MGFAINRLRADNSYRPPINSLWEELVNYLWIGLGAVTGASARYFLSNLIGRHWATTFPYSTLLINVTGSLIVGFFFAYASGRTTLDSRLKFLIAIGFCGSYTTFSSFAFENFTLIERGRWWMAGANFLASNLLCLAAVAGGAVLARGF